ncbi:MAG: primosomal protein N' [Chlamydiae bacterium]|nr:primosomal protein N' [Chlamydiota bacterium]
MYATVILDKSIDTPLEYLVPEHLGDKITAGSRVIVPLKGKPVSGTVLIRHNEKIFDSPLPIAELSSESRFFSDDLFRLAEWMSKYYGASLRKTLLCMIPAIVRKKTKTDEELEIEEDEFFLQEKKSLSEEQQKAFDAIIKTLHDGIFAPHLLFGVTGSGKTEIYLQAIQEARNLGKDVILLVPEISLTPQTIERIKSRFSEKIAILHHRLHSKERFATWHKIKEGEIHIVVGARSAIFSPLKNLGLIIVDEEQEGSYKQMEDTPCYHARDIAIVRAKFANATVLLGSATPSIESFYNAQNHKYILHTLSCRPKGAMPPKIRIVDMQSEREKAQGFSLFSIPLLQGIEQRIKKGEQVLLFLNRRGYYSCQKCEHCDEVIRCKNCDITLTFHKKENELSCHLCGFTMSPPPTVCPSCHREAAFKYKGPGTEQVERSLHKIFPEIRTLRMDRDTTKKKESHDVIFKEFRAGKADVLIGTQMIAKGLHFPSVTLVGVISADNGLMVPDFRSHESCFQILTQVAGRSGRSSLEGEVIFQSSFPSHPVIQFAAKEAYKEFFDEELSSREALSFPPFAQFAKLVLSGKNEEKTKAETEKLHKECKQVLPSSCILYPPIPCGHAKINTRYRFQFLIKGPKGTTIASKIAPLLQSRKRPYGIHILFDVDPLNTFF